MSMSNARFGLVCLAVGSMGVAHAGIYTIERAGSGWVNQNGENNGDRRHNNYIVGQWEYSNRSVESRNWFEFDLSTITETIVSAVLRIDSVDVVLMQDASVVMYDIASYDGLQNFGTMGNGVLYGQREYSDADDYEIRDIVLNEAAIAAMNGSGSFLVSGRISGGAEFGEDVPNQYLMGYSETDPVQLIVTTIPGPGALVMAGVVGVGCARRRR